MNGALEENTDALNKKGCRKSKLIPATAVDTQRRAGNDSVHTALRIRSRLTPFKKILPTDVRPELQATSQDQAANCLAVWHAVEGATKGKRIMQRGQGLFVATTWRGQRHLSCRGARGHLQGNISRKQQLLARSSARP